MPEGLNEKDLVPAGEVVTDNMTRAPDLTPVMRVLRDLWFNAPSKYVPVAKKHHGVSSMPLSSAPTKDAIRFIKDRLEELVK